MSEDRQGGSSGRIFFVVMVVGALVFGLAVGFKLGSESDTRVAVRPTTAPAATAVATPSEGTAPAETPEPRAGDPSTEPGQPSFPPPLIGYEYVADELTQAYYHGGVGVSVCDVSGPPVCHSRPGLVEVPDVDPAAAGFREMFRAGPIEEVTTWAIVVAEDLQALRVDAVLYTEASFPFGQSVVAVNPDQKGIFYMDVSGIDEGRSVLVVRSLNEVPGIGWQEATNVIAFNLVTSPPS